MPGSFHLLADQHSRSKKHRIDVSTHDHTKGLLITFAGGLLLTFDTPLIRLADTDQWTVMFWRSGLAAYAILVYWSFCAGTGRKVAPLINGPYSIVTGLTYGIANACFVVALTYTSVANVVFMLALTPLWAALFSLFLLRETPTLETVIALVASLCGVLIIVWEGINLGSGFGDVLAIIASTVMGLGFTITRLSKRDLSMAPALGSILPFGLACLFISETTFQLEAAQWVWLGLDGLIVVPISAALLTLGPKYISAPEVGMFFLIETVLAPIWVWLVVSEEPGKGSIIGGIIILTTLALHSYIRLRRVKGTNDASPIKG